MTGKLRLVTSIYVTCDGCGYRRFLGHNEAANWIKGEAFSGSQKCPACSTGAGGSAAGWVASNPPYAAVGTAPC